MRVRLKGINSLSKTLADGTRVTYHYAWKGGPRLTGEPGSPEFVQRYHEAHAADRRRPDATMLATVFDAYQDSEAFRGLAERTRKDYARLIRIISAEFGDMHKGALLQKETRGVFRSWRDTRARASKRQADYGWVVLARVLSWALDGGMVEANPCEKGGRLYHGTRADKVWSDGDLEAFLAVARPEMRLALMLALWTGQRQGDLLRLPWSAYDGRYIRLKQSKTGVRVTIPAGAPLKAMLDALPRRSPVVMLSSFKRPWTEDTFRVAWGRTATLAKIDDRTFHDLRGTAVLHLALAGCTVPEIATITGHNLSDVKSILDASYFHRDVALAESGIAKLETRTQTPNRSPNRTNNPYAARAEYRVRSTGWGTWIRTKIDGVRVRCSTVELSPNEKAGSL